MIKELLAKVSAKQDLTFEESRQAIDEIMSGEVSDAVISSFLTALAMKGETEEEIAGAATGMRAKAAQFNIGGHALDIVGTGGDKSNSFNISTTSAFVAACAGVTIVKHGNRAASSKCGTADCLEALGVKIDCESELMKKSLDENNIAFLFAQKYHTAMRFVGPVRKQIGIRTVFNILGPLTNPGKADRMVLGVFSEEYVEKIAKALVKIGVTDAMVVYGMDCLDEIKAQALAMPKGDFEFEKALKGENLSFICEVKKASPSKGVISEDFAYLQIAKEYESAGASAISCLTEPKWFMGSDKYLKEICENVSIPVLRKDFTVCDYQIYEAKVLGAKAVLLICAILDTQTISEYIKICDTLGISALVEAHNEEEIKSAIASGARIIGVNNRNLKDFSVDVNNSTRYRAIIPKDIIFVSESGIKTHEDIEVLQNNKTNAVLIGETFMKSSNKKEMLRELLYGKA